MIKVITYGTFDLLHQGHINLLKRAKALGDYLIVGVTTENFDVTRGKINVSQSLAERMEAVKQTGLADEVFPEEYVGQKIDDIKRHNVSIFAIGSDWEGKFDYLKEYCEVVYLPRTKGISSSMLRDTDRTVLGVAGDDPAVKKLVEAGRGVNGVDISSSFGAAVKLENSYKSYGDLLKNVDAVYVAVSAAERYDYIKTALENGKHVIAESPIALSKSRAKELFDLAASKNLVLFDSIKTAYGLPFSRLILLLKTGIIGEIKSIDATCTSLENFEWLIKTGYYTSFTGWGAVGLLPVFKIFGVDYESADISILSRGEMRDAYTKVNLVYKDRLASVGVGVGVKAEGDMRIVGTDGYVYVPAPWWKSEYFEARFEDASKNKPYYYQNDGEGLTMELVHFLRCIKNGESNYYIERSLSEAISSMMELYEKQLEKLDKSKN